MILLSFLSKRMILELSGFEICWIKRKWDLRCDYMFTYICIKCYLENYWTVPFLSRYRDTDNTRWIQRYRWDEIEAFGARLSTHREFGPCVWALLPFGGLCMQYDDYRDTNVQIHEIWDEISPSIRCSSGAWWFPDCPSVEVRIWWDYSLGYLFDDSFWYSVFDMISIMFPSILCRFM